MPIVRVTWWRWWVCGLLLLATMVNYMDRQTFNLLAKPINDELGITKVGYGAIEGGFSLAFGVGAIIFGFLVDRFNPYWVYPFAVILWSIAGILSGFAWSFESMLAFRVLLGLAEAANWPCALRTTQRLLSREERSMGNSILQSGTAVGSILLPLILMLFSHEGAGMWRAPFVVVGAVGASWVVLWWLSLRPSDLAHETAPRPEARDALPTLPTWLYVRRFAALVILVITINTAWHCLRAWTPLYLRETHDFSQQQVNLFSIGYYICADIGSIAAGAMALGLAWGGLRVHTSRLLTFLFFALITSLAVFLPLLSGWAFIALFLLVGVGALGVFPNYYSFTQDITERHQGKVSGFLGASCWGFLFLWHNAVGWYVEQTKSYTLPLVLSGILPLIGFVAILLLWGDAPDEKKRPLPDGVPPQPAMAGDERVTADAIRR